MTASSSHKYRVWKCQNVTLWHHINPILRELQWLPDDQPFVYKIRFFPIKVSITQHLFIYSTCWLFPIRNATRLIVLVKSTCYFLLQFESMWRLKILAFIYCRWRENRQKQLYITTFSDTAYRSVFKYLPFNSSLGCVLFRPGGDGKTNREIISIYLVRDLELAWSFPSPSRSIHIFAWTTWPETLWPREQVFPLLVVVLTVNWAFSCVS